MHLRRSLLAVFALSAFATGAAHAAGTIVTSSRFTLTFPSEWTDFEFIPTDTLKVLVDTTQQATCNLSATIYAQAVTAQQIADSLGKLPLGTTTLTKVTDGNITLGANSFSYAEWQSTGTGTTTMRVRTYATFKGNLLFTAAVVYEPIAGNTVVTQVESALATLTLNANAAIRAWTAGRSFAALPAEHDALGRIRIEPGRTPAFRLSIH